jgi:hypothetical protein
LASRWTVPGRADHIDLRIARTISQRLGNEYAYTLDLSDANPSLDGIEDFLFEMKKGHCEYFASAMTAMCRLGVHARLTTGFVLGEYDEADAHYIVRGRDAHAWVEVFTPSTGWVIFDPTPPDRREQQGRSWKAGLEGLWDRLEFAWMENVVGYNAQMRRQLWQWVRERLTEAWTALTRSFRTLLLHGQVDLVLARLLFVLSAIALVAELLLLGKWFRQRTRRPRGIKALPPAKVRFLRRLLRLLRRRGLRARPDQTLRDFALEAAASTGTPPAKLTGLIDLYYRMRWGRNAASPAEIRAAEKRVRSLRLRFERQ